MRAQSTLSILATGAVLAGCFGGGGDDTGMTAPAADPLATVPTAVADSLAATVDYQNQLAALNAAAESREPIDLTGVTLAASETAEPIAVN